MAKTNFLVWFSEAGPWKLFPGCACCQCHCSKFWASGFRTNLLLPEQDFDQEQIQKKVDKKWNRKDQNSGAPPRRHFWPHWSSSHQPAGFVSKHTGIDHVQKVIQSTCAESISKNSQLKWKLNFAGAEHRLDKSSCSWRGSCCHRYLSAFSILERALLLPFSCVHWLSFPNVNPIFVIFLIFANISQVWIPILRGSAFPATETLFSIPTSVP